jgi:hypothetical protein
MERDRSWRPHPKFCVFFKFLVAGAGFEPATFGLGVIKCSNIIELAGVVGYEKLFQGIDRKLEEFGGWVDVGLNSDQLLFLADESFRRSSAKFISR